MDVGYFFIYYIRPAFIKLVDDIGYGFFIAGNKLGRKNNSIILFHSYLFVRTGRHTRKGGQWFPLAAGGNHDYFVIRKFVYLVYVYLEPVGHFQIAEVFCNADAYFNASAVENNLFISIFCDIDYLPDPCDIGGKKGDDYPAPCTP